MVISSQSRNAPGFSGRANCGQAALVREDPAEGDIGLAVLSELGPVVGDPPVDVEFAALGQAPGEDGADGLADRVTADDGVIGPGLGVFGVGPAAVDVDDQLSVERNRERSAGLRIGRRSSAEIGP